MSIRRRGGTARELDYRSLRCLLCGGAWAERARMLADAERAVCSDCVIRAVALLAGHDGRERGVLAATGAMLRQIIDGLPPRSSFAVTTPLLSAALPLAAGDPVACRALAASAARLSRFELAAQAIAAIAPGAGEPIDAISVAHYLDQAGAPARGWDALAALDPADLDPRLRLYHRMVRTGLDLHRSRERDDAGWLEELGAGLAQVRDQLEVDGALLADGPEIERMLAAVERGLGECALRAGKLAAAENWLRAAIDRAADSSPEALLLLGDVAVARGRAGEAREAWKRAADVAHPESPAGRVIASRLGSAYR